MMAQIEIENRMVVDSEWNEEDYHYPSKERLRREKNAHDAEEYGLEEEE